MNVKTSNVLLIKLSRYIKLTTVQRPTKLHRIRVYFQPFNTNIIGKIFSDYIIGCVCFIISNTNTKLLIKENSVRQSVCYALCKLLSRGEHFYCDIEIVFTEGWYM